MADEPDEVVLDERLEAIQRRAENFRELLKEGDEVVIALQDGEMLVEESYRSKFERQHPKLFGRMLSIETQMETGLLPYFAALVLTGVLIVGLPMKWWDSVLGETLADYLQSWWFYVPLPIAMLYLARTGCAQWEKHVYRRNRPDLMELLTADKLDRDVLLVTLREESELENVLYQMKRDTGPF